MQLNDIYKVFPIKYNNRSIEIISLDILEIYINILRDDFYNKFSDFNFKSDIEYVTLHKILKNSIDKYDRKSSDVYDIRLVLKDISTGIIIGGCSLIFKDIQYKSVELSYFVLPQYQNSGEAYKMLKTLIDEVSKSSFEFEYFKVVIQNHNKGSIKLANKLGFILKDCCKGKYTYNNIYYLERL